MLFVLAPLLLLGIGSLLGVCFKFDLFKLKSKRFIPLLIFSVATALGLFFLSNLFSANLASTKIFQNFASIFEENYYAIIKYNAQFLSVIVLIGFFEVGLGSGFALAIKSESTKLSKIEKSTSPKEETSLQPKKVTLKLEGSAPDSLTTSVGKSLTKTNEIEDNTLTRDEQSIMELFLYGKVNEIVPLVNVTKPEGYLFEGIPQLDWETKRSKQVLDSLVRKSYLSAELSDKIVVCKTCGSANVRFRKACPECKSLRLHKENLLEHFSCGAVERQSSFITEKGDLVCPKCNYKLQLIGSDYRALPPAYLCQECNTLNSEPFITAKCVACGSTSHIDEEPDVFLYKYTANSAMPLEELQQIKPLDTCTKFFKSLGYTIVVPAFVSGRSGTQHLFDILILGKVGWVEGKKSNVIQKTELKNDNGNTAVEVLISNRPVELEEITRIYGKISDIDCDFMLFAIPGLTSESRNYADAYNMKVSEGKNIEQALANSKIPRVSGEIA